MKRKIYEPVRELERRSSYCPLYLAWRVLDEARDYFRAPISERYATDLARRAEGVFAKHPFWRRKYQSRQGRENVLMCMRHWLASALAAERPALCRALPDRFKMGQPLPETHQPVTAVADRRIASENLKVRRSQRAATTVLRRRQPASHFVHGCELLAV